MKFTEAKLEKAIVGLLADEGYLHVDGESIDRSKSEVLPLKRGSQSMKMFLCKFSKLEKTIN